MSIYKIAQRYENLVRQANSANYADLVSIHEMAQALAMDPYEELSPEEGSAAIEIAKLTAALADRAYRSGLSASELKWSADKIKNKLLNYGMDSKLNGIKDQLGAILSKFQGLVVSDIPGQMGGSTYKAQPGMEIGPIEVSEPAALEGGDLSPELRQTIDELMAVNPPSYEDETQPFHGETVINPAHSY